jgi:energy-coupling factor transporter ATP-binding protein EcfA2
MALLHRIELACGPDGEDGDGLAFDAGRVNLIVGPNNAGKSLLLRELAGFNPRDRERRYRTYDRSGWLPGQILTSVSYGAQAQADVEERVKHAVLKPEDPVGAALLAKPLSEILDIIRENERDVALVVEDIRQLLPGAQTPGIDPLAAPLMRAIFDQFPPFALFFSQAQFQLGPQGHAAWTIAAEQVVAVVVPRALTMLARAGVAVDLASFVPPAAEELLVAATDVVDGRAVGSTQVQDWWTFLQRFEKLFPWFLDTKKWSSLRQDLEGGLHEQIWGAKGTPQDLREGVIFLDGMARLALPEPDQLRPWHSDGKGIVGKLLDDDAGRELLRKLVHHGLGRWLVVDQVTEAPTVLFRLSASPPADRLAEQHREAETAAFMREATDLRERSDGTVAYVGILAAIIASKAKMVCIDEPEAFLHPPLARTLARQLTQLARERDIQLFVATHSADFVAGCVTADPDTRILRLTFDGEAGKARQLDAEVLRAFSLNPALRSTSALVGLFASAVVVGEADSDRAFYQEIHERLADEVARQGRPRPDGWAFMNANGWHQIARLAGPLRAMGVPVAVIIDADALSGGKKLTELLRACNVPDGELEPYRIMANNLGSREPDSSGGYPKGADIRQMAPERRRVLATLCANLAGYGIFVVPVGELEDWFGARIDARKDRWLEQAFLQLGSDPMDSNYQRPGADDVWAFMRGVDEWVRSQQAGA